MWTVLLVEDEMFVRDSIKQIINWKTEWFTVIGEANNGLEAFQFIEQHQPDLVICDIKMPVMNGIEVLKKVRAEGWTNQFLMLTAHTEFEYTRQAVEFGASNYILKLSMSVDSLISSLQKVRSDLEQAREQKFTGMQEIYQKAWDVLTEDTDAKSEVNLPMEKVNDEYLVIIAMLEPLTPVTTKDIKNMQLVQSNGAQVIHSFFAMGHVTFFYWSNQPPKVNSEFTPIPDIQFVFSSISKPSCLLTTWRDVILTLDKVWYQEQKSILIKTGTMKSQSVLSIPWELERLLFQFFEQMKIEECREILGQIWEYMGENRFSMIKVKKIAKWMDQTFVKMAHLQEGMEQKIDNTKSHKQLETFMFESISSYMTSKISEALKLTNHPEVNKVMEYIAVHFYEYITVKQMAKYISMDENYLSGLFKRKTGESLIHYLHRVRIRKAEDYLINYQELTISKIAEAVGFVNDNYFIKIFKRINKETPSQYRRNFLKLESVKKGEE